MTIADEYVSVKEAAAELGVHPSTIWRWIDAERLPAVRIGPKTIRIHRRDVAAARRPSPRSSEPHAGSLRHLLTPMTEGERERGREAMERIRAIAAGISARRGGKPFSSGADIIREAREQRSRRI